MRLSSSFSGKPKGDSAPPAGGRLVYFDSPKLFACGVLLILIGGGVPACFRVVRFMVDFEDFGVSRLLSNKKGCCL